MRSDSCPTLQLMVAPAKEKARQLFGKLFNAELDRVEFPGGRQRIGAVFEALKEKGVPLVSREQVRKYVRGKDMPDQANLQLIVKRLKLDWARLASAGSAATTQDPMLLELEEVWRELPTDTDRVEVIKFARFRLGQSVQSGEAQSKRSGTSRS